jgi:hypothetical protein
VRFGNSGLNPLSVYERASPEWVLAIVPSCATMLDGTRLGFVIMGNLNDIRLGDNHCGGEIREDPRLKSKRVPDNVAVRAG